MSRLDWIAATVPDFYEHSPVDLLLPIADEPPSLVRGQNGYSRGWQLRREGAPFATVYEGPRLAAHVVATGSDAEAVGGLLRRRVEGLRVARADVCADFLGGQSFYSKAARIAADVADARGIMTEGMFSEDRRAGVRAETLYLGGRKSETRLRIYEKGKQDDSYDPETIRIEAQIRPQSRERKVYAGTLEPDALWGFAAWLRELSSELLSLSAPAPPPRGERVSDLDGSLNTMCWQYRNRLHELLALHGGDLAAFGADLIARTVDPMTEGASDG